MDLCPPIDMEVNGVKHGMTRPPDAPLHEWGFVVTMTWASARDVVLMTSEQR